MNTWEKYCDENTARGGRHVKFKQWRISGVWEFTRSDGLRTAHKNESPFIFWKDAIEESMTIADLYIPLRAELPEGMRSREDPDYTLLFEKISVD